MRADGSIVHYGFPAVNTPLPPSRNMSYSTSSSIPGYNTLVGYLGQPNLSDGAAGGIAIWSRAALRARGFSYLQRVEILDEKILSVKPKPHYSNIYIWFRVPLTPEKLQNVMELSTDMYYDRKKELLIVRSNDIYTAIAQAVLVGLYAIDKVSYYRIVNDNLHLRYFNMVAKPKMCKLICTLAKHFR